MQELRTTGAPAKYGHWVRFASQKVPERHARDVHPGWPLCPAGSQSQRQAQPQDSMPRCQVLRKREDAEASRGWAAKLMNCRHTMEPARRILCRIFLVINQSSNFTLQALNHRSWREATKFSEKEQSTDSKREGGNPSAKARNRQAR